MKFNFLARIFVIISCLSNTSFGQLYKNYKDAINMEFKDSVTFIRLDSNDCNLNIDLSLFPNLDGFSLDDWKSGYHFLKGADSITQLQIYNCSNLNEFDLTKYDNLVDLGVYYSQGLRIIELSSFKNLKEFGIGDLEGLAELDFTNAQNLEILRMRGIKNLNIENLSHLVNLKELSFTFSEGVSDLNFSIFSRLEELEISNNQLKEFPLSITQLKNLKVLDIGEYHRDAYPMCLDETYHQTQNKIAALPESIGDLTDLEDLDISFNPILTLPQSLKKLTKLTFIDISKTDIQEIPDFIISGRTKEISLRYFTGNANNFSRKTKMYLLKQDFRASSTVKCKEKGRFKRVSKSLGI
jgi:Leucine-rich repeat (LRR) protein